jgi:lipopolysaccharide export LptBFGC system permease protein LptF
MTWTNVYRLTLHLLPAELRRKHGQAMEALFAREIGRARAQGRLRVTLVGAAGVGDVIQRAAYEQVRPMRDAEGARREHGSLERRSTHARGPQSAGANLSGPHMPQPTSRQLLRRHAAAFTIAFAALTLSMLAYYATRQVPALRALGVPAGTVAKALLLAVPFIAAMTIPIAVLIAVLWEFTRLGADGTLASARRERGGVLSLTVPVLAAAAVVGALALVVTAEIVPRTNAQLAVVLSRDATAPSDRTMTIRELRRASRGVRPGTDPIALARAAAFEVEVQKKFALPAGCVVLALVGVALVLRFPRGGVGLVIGATGAVWGAYYVLMIAGESLADRLVVSPFVGMWGANAFLLAAALLTVWRRRPPVTSIATETVLMHG